MELFRYFLLLCALLAISACASPRESFSNATHHPLYHEELLQIVSRFPVTRMSLDTTSRAGLTLDPCESNSDCQGDRLCVTTKEGINNLVLCLEDDDDCVCYTKPEDSIYCTDSVPCELGETCATNGAIFPKCVSAEAAEARDFIIVTEPPGTGLTRESCSDISDCQGDRLCKFAFNTATTCGDRDPCFCVPPDNGTECCSNADCIPGEVCAIRTDVEGATPFCVAPMTLEREPVWVPGNCTETPSPTASQRPDPSETPTRTPKPTTSEDSTPVTPPPPISESPSSSPGSAGPSFSPILSPPAICIGVHQLQHLQKSDLVFRQHAWANVLCDGKNSCATPGHMVVYEGRPMMMSSYCMIVGCERRMMKVNSPRYGRRKRISSLTEGLEFTAFAARYETKFEQSLMVLAVKIGL